MKVRKIAKSKALPSRPRTATHGVRDDEDMKIDELPKWDPAEVLTDEETIAAYLAEAARDPDPAFYQRALDNAARARAKNRDSD